MIQDFQLVNLHNLIVCGRTIEYHHGLGYHIKTGEDDDDLWRGRERERDSPSGPYQHCIKVNKLPHA